MANQRKVAAYHRRRKEGLAGKWKKQDDIVFYSIIIFWTVTIICGILRYP